MSEYVVNPSYGDYILRTGQGIIGEYELLLGKFFYQRFKGRSRIVDLGPGRCWFTKQNPDSIIAVDNSAELVRHFGQQGINIQLGDARDLGLPDNFVDGGILLLSVRASPKPIDGVA